MAEIPSNEIGSILVAPPYRFDMGLRRGTGTFFRNSSEGRALLAARGAWLEADPTRYAGALEEAAPLLEEAAAWASTLNPELPDDLGPAQGTVAELCRRLGTLWEPDFLLLKPQEGDFRLLAGCVCFPSSWDLSEKLGRSLDWIHGAVPRLNEELGLKIRAFLSTLRPGTDWERVNWGLAASGELNHHPARALPRLGAGARLESTWLRIEHQALRVLPASGGILFGLRVQVEPLAAVCASPETAGNLRSLLETMPEDVAHYKGLAQARGSLVRELAGGGA